MKRIKVTINPGSPGRTFPLFSTIEAAYVWLSEAHDDPTVLDRIDGVEKLPLFPNEFIEAEWVGCEYAYDEGGHVRIDLVHVAKGQPTQNAAGALVSVHRGWVVDHILPFRNYKDEDISVQRLGPDDKYLDLSQLFVEDE